MRPPEDHEARLPDATDIEGIIDAAFWASLRREEGYEPEDLAGVSAARADDVAR